jgi:prepilin-type N-terminal cleavage/methylation domain-containing protein
MFAPHRRPRRAFTMVELLVVIAIILTVTVIGYLVLPKNMAADYNRTRGIDQMMEWLLTAKQRAKRDLLPTGIRLIDPATNQASATNLPTAVMFIQQPDTLAGTSTGGTCKMVTATKSPYNVSFTGVDFVGGAAALGLADQALVQAGDYLVVPSSTGPNSTDIGVPHQITSVSGSSSAPTLTLNSAITIPANTSNFFFFRQPRPISGEEVKQLPTDLVIDLNSGQSLNVPTRTVTVGATTTTFVEILFSQSGAVVGYGTAGGKIALMMRDVNTTVITTGTVSVTGPPPTLIGIQPRTGFIGAFDVATGGTNAYQYMEDGRSSGF